MVLFVLRSSLNILLSRLDFMTEAVPEVRGSVASKHEDRVKSFAGAALTLASLAFITRNAGNINPGLCSTVSVLLMLAIILLYLPPVPSRQDPCGEHQAVRTRWLLYSSTFVLFAVSATLVITRNVAAGILGLAVLLCGLLLIWEQAEHARRDLPPLLLTVLLFGAYELVVGYLPWAWSLSNRVALTLSEGISRIGGRDAHLAATFSGLSLVVLFALYILSLHVFSTKHRLPALAAGLLALLVAEAAYIGIWPYVQASSIPDGLATARPFMSAYDFKLLLFVFMLFPVMVLWRSIKLRDVRLVPERGKVKFMAAALLALMLCVSLLAFVPSSKSKAGEILLFDTKKLDWSAPDFERFGLKNLGMFGLLDDYISSYGYSARKTSTLAGAELKGARTLVLINLDRKLGDSEKDAVWHFVREGGSLLVLGDHTGAQVIRDPYNDLLTRVGITFEFDSAAPLQEKWGNGFQLMPSTLFDGISADQLQVNIGASLSLSGSARPLVIGRFGFSDKGNKLAADNGFLGNLKYTPDEKIGDLVLVAGADYGHGKVLAFGDTTSFQNGALTYSGTFVKNVFKWLASSGRGQATLPAALIAVALLAVGLGLVLTMGLDALSLAAAIFVLTAGLMFFGAVSRLPASARPPPGGSALIEASHLERFDARPLGDNSIDGLAANLMRNGYKPSLMKEFSPEALDRSSVLAIIAPAKSFSPSELEAIKSFIGKGGRLLISVGAEEFDGSRALLWAFGMEIGSAPLGKTAPGPGVVNLWEAWPVEAREGESSVLARAWEYPVVRQARFGAGTVTVIGDSSFLLNKNLEGVEYHSPGNIEFLKEQIGQAR